MNPYYADGATMKGKEKQSNPWSPCLLRAGGGKPFCVAYLKAQTRLERKLPLLPGPMFSSSSRPTVPLEAVLLSLVSACSQGAATSHAAAKVCLGSGLPPMT